MNRTTRTLSAVALGATVFAGLQGTASAQTREHILLARQTQVPATTTVDLDLVAPTDEPVLAAWLVRYEGIDGSAYRN
jgi:hypothetical protein